MPTLPSPPRPALTMAGAGAVTTLGALPPFLLGAQAVFLREDLGLALGDLGMAVSAFFAAATVASVSGAGLLDRSGRRVGMLGAGILVAGGGVAMATAVTDLAGLVGVMALLGVGNAACQVTSNLTVARALPPGRRGLGFGIKQAAVPLAIMIAGLAVPTVGATLGWRVSYLVTAAGGLVLLVLACLTRPRDAAPQTVPATGWDRPPSGPLALCALAVLLASAAVNFMSAYLPSWAFEVGLTPSQAGLLVAAGSGASIMARVLVGHRADGRHGANLPVVAVQMAVGALALLTLATGRPWVVVVSGLLVFTAGWSWPGLFLFAVARVGRDAPARASAAVQAGAFAGGALGPLLLGAVVGRYGFEAAWVAAAAASLGGALLVSLARRWFLRDLAHRPPRVQLHYGGGRRAPARTTTLVGQKGTTKAGPQADRPS